MSVGACDAGLTVDLASSAFSAVRGKAEVAIYSWRRYEEAPILASLPIVRERRDIFRLREMKSVSLCLDCLR